MSASFDTLLYETNQPGVATVTINRPEKLNALNDNVLNELAEVFKQINIDDTVRGCILTGTGDKAFVAGADIKELRELNEHRGRMASQKGQQIFQLIEDTRKPVIALVNGYALGGGAELAMACHLRVATENAVFGLPEVGLGLIPGYGGTQRLPRIVGRAKALELILTGKQLSAEQAQQIGLVNRVVSQDYGWEEVEKMMDAILKNGPLAVKQAMRAVYHSDHKSGFQIESELFGYLCGTDDAEEGLSAFLEKRKPNFKGI
ncbi:enoyl-CoA hydratase-related protein [Aliifodinibius sp. S!AR15-10]|uniref:enoyl-CoA hydratase/isomerase family protein n=1 Tax=Aliifodinibius sp. S!AR15-10 TaxID=2950437 RepID=UPI00285E62E8|nr:enoyl-CoA hydratase-related protein [Aliifodinibius sp. S!AR15-10]MDR8389752.1 enoyl-CoA hydratase-related protein [Aliifodinibius sp. S!AR15-10]